MDRKTFMALADINDMEGIKRFIDGAVSDGSHDELMKIIDSGIGLEESIFFSKER